MRPRETKEILRSYIEAHHGNPTDSKESDYAKRSFGFARYLLNVRLREFIATIREEILNIFKIKPKE